MDNLALVMYVILTIILITLMVVLGWLYYDYSKFKDDINSNFASVNSKFDSQKEVDTGLRTDIDSNFDELGNIETDLYDSTNDDGETIDGIKTKVTNSEEEIKKIKQYVGKETVGENIGTGLMRHHETNTEHKKLFHDNLNKYFEFGTPDQGLNSGDNSSPGNIGSMWIYDINDRGDSNDDKLKLIQETTVAANMTVQTDAIAKNLKICNNDKSTCYKLYVDGNNNLNIQQDAGSSSHNFVIGDHSIPVPATPSEEPPDDITTHTHEYVKTEGSTPAIDKRAFTKTPVDSGPPQNQ